MIFFIVRSCVFIERKTWLVLKQENCKSAYEEFQQVSKAMEQEFEGWWEEHKWPIRILVRFVWERTHNLTNPIKQPIKNNENIFIELNK